MHKMPGYNSTVERRLQLCASAVYNSAAYVRLLVAVNVGNLAAYQPVPSHKFGVPFL